LITKNIQALVPPPVKPPPIQPKQDTKSSMAFLQSTPGQSDTERMYNLLKQFNALSIKLFLLNMVDVAQPRPNISLPQTLAPKDQELYRIKSGLQPVYSTLWEAIQSTNQNSYVYNPTTRLFYVIEDYQISKNTPKIAKEIFENCTYDPERHVVLSKYSSDAVLPKYNREQTVSKYKRNVPFDILPTELKHTDYQYDSEDEDDDFEKMFNNVEFGVQLEAVERDDIQDEDFLTSLADDRVAHILRTLQKDPTLKLSLNDNMLIRIRDQSRQHIFDADINENDLQRIRAKLIEDLNKTGRQISPKRLEEAIRKAQQEFLVKLQSEGLTDIRYVVVALITLSVLTSLPNRTTVLPIPMSLDSTTDKYVIQHIVNCINSQIDDTDTDLILDATYTYKIFKRFRDKPSWKLMYEHVKQLLEGNKTAIQKENVIILDRYFLWKTFRPLKARPQLPERQVQTFSMIGQKQSVKQAQVRSYNSTISSVSFYSAYQPKKHLSFETPLQEFDKHIKKPFARQQTNYTSIENKWNDYGDNTSYQNLSSNVARLVSNDINLGMALFVIGSVSITLKDVYFLYNFIVSVLKPTLQHIANMLTEDSTSKYIHLEPDDKLYINQFRKQYVSRLKEFYINSIMEACAAALKDPVLENTIHFEIDVNVPPVEAIYVYSYCIAKTLKSISAYERLYLHLVDSLLIQQHFAQHTLNDFDIEYRKQREQEKNKLINEKKVMDAEAKRLQRELKTVGIAYVVQPEEQYDNDVLLPQFPRNERERELADNIRENQGEEADVDD
jgi:hypothetical protein